MEMMFEVCEFDMRIYMKLLFLIMHRNEGVNYHVLCRSVKKEAGLLFCIRCFTLVFFFDDQKEEKLPVSYILRAEEGTMSC